MLAVVDSCFGLVGPHQLLIHKASLPHAFSGRVIFSVNVLFKRSKHNVMTLRFTLVKLESNGANFVWITKRRFKPYSIIGSYITAPSRSYSTKGKILQLARVPTGAKCFAFYYHMNGYNMGDLFVRAGSSLQNYNLRLKLILKSKPGARWRLAQIPLQDDEKSVSTYNNVVGIS